MKNLIKIATFLFAIHTIEEAVTLFWTRDVSVQWLSNILNLSHFVSYWLVQIVLYLFLFALIFLTFKKPANFFYAILGFILLGEFQHVWATISVGQYVSGLYTGILLCLFSIYFWAVFIKIYKSQNY